MTAIRKRIGQQESLSQHYALSSTLKIRRGRHHHEEASSRLLLQRFPIGRMQKGTMQKTTKGVSPTHPTSPKLPECLAGYGTDVACIAESYLCQGTVLQPLQGWSKPGLFYCHPITFCIGNTID